MLENNARDDLARMFQLFNNVPSSLPCIASIFKEHIKEQGKTALAAATPSKEVKTSEASKAAARSAYIELLMKHHTQFLGLVTNCFQGNTVFHKALKEAFETIVNLNVGTHTTAELLADYANSVLQKGQHMLSLSLSLSLDVFCYVLLPLMF